MQLELYYELLGQARHQTCVGHVTCQDYPGA